MTTREETNEEYCMRKGIPYSANNRQVGGDHYQKDSPIQHWDIVAMFNLDYFQGQITKYVMRWQDKNGIQDLEKAQHFLEKYIEQAKAAESRKQGMKAGAIRRAKDVEVGSPFCSGCGRHEHEPHTEECPLRGRAQPGEPGPGYVNQG